MGAFKKPKYRESAADKAIREDIEKRRKLEVSQKKILNSKMAPKKRRKTHDVN